MKLVFVHGWGSGPFLWKEITPHFSGHECHLVNLGFLGEKDVSVPNEKFVGIGHSLGGAWLLKHYPDQMTGFISIASFNCFYKYVPTQVLNMMKRNIAKDVTKQLKDFWHHAGLDHPGGFKNLKPAKLIEGLSWLGQWQSDIPAGLPVKALASRDDHIVPADMSQSIWGDYDLTWTEDGGHMLPLTKPEWCTTYIKEFLNALEP
jgi:pimeloyl-[acyl-carrier protein] methyl ester esterase